jgi:hypothetical protein
MKMKKLFKAIAGVFKKREKPYISNLEIWAQKELDLLLADCKDKESREMQKLMNDGIMRIVHDFCGEGHSGFSASYALSIIRRLLDWKPIKPLTGEDDEWSEMRDPSDDSQQNIRCSAVFRKHNDNSTAFYLYGKTFSDNGGISWFTRGGPDGSSVSVTFPYHVPDKTEHIYLDETGEREDARLTSIALEQARQTLSESKNNRP